MGLEIEAVDAGSLAERAGLRAGDRVMRVNGHAVRDVIDFQYHAADEAVRIGYERDGTARSVEIIRDPRIPLGIEVEPMRCTICGNRCVFCFVDQNPPGLRKTLYVRDEDYRLSFLHGNYVTLTRVGGAELRRIVSLRLSPLYLSIHATEYPVRKRLLGLGSDDRLLEKMRFLADHGIEMHGQIVLCPGLNDGAVLERTLRDLAAFHPALQSVAVVPVGLTRHREGLPVLRPADADAARDILAALADFQASCLGRLGTRFVYGADEWYVLSGAPLPDPDAYEGYPQIENGVGLVRSFLEDLIRKAETFPGEIADTLPSLWVVGQSAAHVLGAEALPVFRRIRNLDLRIKAVPNRFFGASVTVTGLLSGRDVLHALQDEAGPYRVLIPPVCLNPDGLFLDDLTPGDLSRELNRPVRVLAGFEDFYG